MSSKESTDSEDDLEILYQRNNSKIIEKTPEPIKGMETLKIEVYDRVYVEEYQHREFLQIQYYLPPSLHNVEDISEPERNRLYFNAMRNLLCPIVTNSRGFATRNVHTVRNLQISSQLKNQIDTVLDLVPYEGFLAPRECQLISVSFYPKPDTAVRANAICSVLGGVTRKIFIQGKASDMAYELDSDFIDFGRQVM